MAINFYNVDCMEFMQDKPENYYDLAIVDPPYGIGNWVQQTGNVRGKKVEWNDHGPNEAYFKELERVSKERIIWGANYYNCFNDLGGAIIWNKHNPNPKFSQAEIASYSRLKRVAVYDLPYYGFVGEDKCFHPCAKPVKLYEWLLMNYAKEGDKILDTHGGSMSIAIAVHNVNEREGMNLSLDVCEIDKDYFDAAVERFNRHVAQTTIFT